MPRSAQRCTYPSASSCSRDQTPQPSQAALHTTASKQGRTHASHPAAATSRFRLRRPSLLLYSVLRLPGPSIHSYLLCLSSPVVSSRLAFPRRQAATYIDSGHLTSAAAAPRRSPALSQSETASPFVSRREARRCETRRDETKRSAARRGGTTNRTDTTVLSPDEAAAVCIYVPKHVSK
ncbi:hypothetical protein BC567DRAFT_98321 [Phyllosticta citribraziliensis]